MKAAFTDKDFVYLMCPYSHKLNAVENYRHDMTNSTAAYLMATYKVRVFNPIGHSHPLARQLETLPGGSPLGWSFWMSLDLDIIDKVITQGVILTLPGWLESKGVAAEIKRLREQNKPIHLFNSDTLSLEPFDPDAYDAGLYAKLTEVTFTALD